MDRNRMLLIGSVLVLVVLTAYIILGIPVPY